MLTDDPGTPGNRKWEINIGANVERNTVEDLFLIPFLDLNYGLGERIQLKYEVPWVISNQKEDSTPSGPGNSVLGVKYRFLGGDTHGVAASVYPQVEFNTSDSSADRGLADKGTMLFLPFEIQKQIGWLGVDGEAGYLFRRGEDVWVYGLLLGHTFAKVEVLAELHGTGLKNFKTNHDLVNFGYDGTWRKRKLSTFR